MPCMHGSLQNSCLENSWTEEPGRLSPQGCRAGHDWYTHRVHYSQSLGAWLLKRREEQDTCWPLEGTEHSTKLLPSNNPLCSSRAAPFKWFPPTPSLRIPFSTAYQEETTVRNIIKEKYSHQSSTEHPLVPQVQSTSQQSPDHPLRTTVLDLAGHSRQEVPTRTEVPARADGVCRKHTSRAADDKHKTVKGKGT